MEILFGLLTIKSAEEKKGWKSFLLHLNNGIQDIKKSTSTIPDVTIPYSAHVPYIHSPYHMLSYRSSHSMFYLNLYKKNVYKAIQSEPKLGHFRKENQKKSAQDERKKSQ